MSHEHMKDLVDLLHAQSMENMMTSISNQTRHAIILQENINSLRKESIKKCNDEKPSHLVMGN
jgi:ketol-acid reductoisomerase